MILLNRTALNYLLTSSNEMCKVIHSECCVYIAGYDNYTIQHIIEHTRKKAHSPQEYTIFDWMFDKFGVIGSLVLLYTGYAIESLSGLTLIIHCIKYCMKCLITSYCS